MAEEIYATFETSMGDIVVKLLPERAPKTVENFVGLAEGTKEFTNEKTGKKEKRPIYDGPIFHRVIPDFMIQGGCPHGNGMGGLFRFADQNLTLIERFTRSGPDGIAYEFTVDDSTVWTRPWSAMVPWTRARGAIYEYACHEGNYSLANMLSVARYEERGQ